MSKATSAVKLVKWLANQADDVAASADDLKRYGPQAAKVRSLLDFIPTMSDDAARVSDSVYRAADRAAYNAATTAAGRAVRNNAQHDAYIAARSAALGAASTAARDAARDISRSSAIKAAYDAGGVESISHLIDPNTYRILNNPLAAGRAVDLLAARPRNQGTQFLDVVRSMGERGALTGPRDVVVASRLDKSPKEILETALTLMSDGMSAEDAMRAARLL